LIVVDSSALIAIALDEPRADDCIRALEEADSVLIAAPTLTESLIVAARRGAGGPMSDLLQGFGFDVIPLTERRARAAAAAYRQWGKGSHAASLNFGDCFSYAAAHEHRCPLLFVDDDFAKTDLKAAI
jgi:ribonuclease VapC